MRTDLDSSARAMARGAAANLAGSAAGMGLAFLLTFVVTQFVPVREVGFLAIGATVVGLAVIPAILGLETGVIRFVALGAAHEDERAARAAAQVAIGIVALTSLALTAVLWWQAPALAERFFHKPEATELIRILSLSLAGMALTRVTVGAVQGFGMMGYTAWLGIVRSGTNLAMALLLLGLGLGAEGVAVAAVVTAYVAFAAAVAFLLRTHPRALVPAPGAWRVGRMLRFSLPQTLTGLLFWAVLWTDTALLGRFGTAAEVGIYAVATRLLIPASTISTAVGQMFAPRIAAEDARGNRAALSRMLKRVTYWNTSVSIPIFVTLALIPGPLLGLFGETYTSGATALAILAIGQLVNTAAGPLGQVINMSGRPYITMVNNALVAAINLGACLILIPRYGMTGAAISFAGSLTLVNVIKLVQVRVLFGMYPFRADTLRTLLAAAVAAGLAAPVAFLMTWPNALSEVVAATAIIFVVYLQLMRVLGLNPEDRELFRGGPREDQPAAPPPYLSLSRMLRLIATTVVRESIRGKQRTGFVYDVDWDDQRVARRFPVPEPRFPESDDNPRGGVRGGRGVAPTRHGIVVANYDTLSLYDDGWNVLQAFSHPLFVGIHEIDWDGTHVWATATGIDAILKVALDGEAAVAWDPHEERFAKRFRLRKRPHPIDGSVDYRVREAPLLDQCHMNAVTRLGGSLVVNCGLIRRAKPTPLRIATRLQMRARRRLGAGTRKETGLRNSGPSAVVRVDGNGAAELLAQSGPHDFPTHNGQLLDGSRVIVNDSTANAIRLFDLDDGREVGRVGVPGTWLRGLERLDDSRVFVGTAPAAVVLVDLGKGTIEQSLQLSRNPNEAIHGLALCPPLGERP